MRPITNIARAAAIAAIALTGSLALEASAFAETAKTHSAPINPAKTVVSYALKHKDLSTLVAALKEAGLVDTLSGKGPFTVFAPSNEAFAKLPKGTLATLMKPENKDKLVSLLKYHVVAGVITKNDIIAAAAKHGGRVSYNTIGGGALTFDVKGKTIAMVDPKGHDVKIHMHDAMQSNGIVHVINRVLIPH